MEDSIFIEVLKFGEKKGLEGTDYNELSNWIIKNGFAESADAKKDNKAAILSNLFDECFDYPRGGNKRDKANLKTEYYFRLIEYRELQASRMAARSANRNAMYAIRISIFAIIVSAVLTFTQLNAPVSVNKSDLQALINSNTSANVQREVKLDSLQMAQILSAIGYRQPKPENDRKKSLYKDQGKEVSHHQLINKYFEGESGTILKE